MIAGEEILIRAVHEKRAPPSERLDSSSDISAQHVLRGQSWYAASIARQL
jgi:hypothetical protein